MNILVACEESQEVTKRMRSRGHNAYSCDILETSGNNPEWHIKGDVIPLLKGNCSFMTSDNKYHSIIGKWDMLIAFPPCTHLAVSGARHFPEKRKDGRQREAIEFFCKFFNADCDKISIENPVNIIGGNYVKLWYPDLCNKYNLPKQPTQYIQPYEFGDKSRKKTGLWLKGLPKLIPTNIVEPELDTYIRKDGRITTFSKGFSSGFTQENRSRVRSKTFPGIAEAMATQWG